MEAAAVTVGGFALLPGFAEQDAGSDWNDLARGQGMDIARRQFGDAVAIAEREQMVRNAAAGRSQSPSQQTVLSQPRAAEVELERLPPPVLRRKTDAAQSLYGQSWVCLASAAFVSRQSISALKAAAVPSKALPLSQPGASWMSKAFIANVLQESADLTGVGANQVAGDLMAAIVKEMKKAGKFTLPGFGTFTVKKTKPRTAMNPRTGEKVKVKAGKTVRFKASPSLKQRV